MRILLTTEASSAGVGHHILDLAEGLLQRNHQVDLVYSPLRIDDVFAQRLAGLTGLMAVPIDMRRVPHVSDLAVIRRLRAHVESAGPFDIVHAHSSKAGAVTRLRRLAPGAALVYTPHCIFTMNPMLGTVAYRVTQAIERALAWRTDAIIAVSPEEHDHIVRLGVRPDKVHFVANAIRGPIRRDRDLARRQLGLPQHGVILGFVGRLSEQKDPVMLLRAFARLAGRYPDLSLAIAGDGPLQREGRKVAAQLGIAQSVYWLGYQRAEDIMPALDIFTLPSRYEGMPYVLLEALAAGLPIVSTLVGGTSVAVDMDGNGTIVPTHEPKDFADALCPLIGSSELRQRFARASRTKSRRLTTDAMVDKTCAIYRELVPGGDESFPWATPHTIPGMWPEFEEQENAYGLGNPV